MAAPLILARTFQDAHAYARDELGLSNGYYRVVNSPGTIKAVRNVDIHLVPGWDKRPDRFTMKGALRYCRLNIIDVAAQRESAAAFDASMSPPDISAERAREILDGPKPSQIGTIDGTPVIEHESDEAAAAAALAELPEPADAAEVLYGCAPEEAAGVRPEEAEGEVVPELLKIAEDIKIEDGNIPTVVSEEAQALADAKPKARRRRKCKDCEQMHYKGDPCIDSEAV